jgi:predicted transport protein
VSIKWLYDLNKNVINVSVWGFGEVKVIVTCVKVLGEKFNI